MIIVGKLASLNEAIKIQQREKAQKQQWWNWRVLSTEQ